jgi:phosphonate dehydrogenase
VHEEALGRLAAVGEVDANPACAPWPRTEVVRRAERADALMAFMNDRIDAAFIAACPRLQVVACALKGADNFDVGACEKAGVWLSIVPDLLTAPTAELAVGMAIALGRRLRDGDAIVRSGEFDGWRPILYGFGLDGSTVAIVGMGAVGRAIAGRLSGFGCRILGVDSKQPMPIGVEHTDFEDALAAADYLILAVPLAEANRHLLARATLTRMKRSALVINVGRGSVVDESAIGAALEAGNLGGYAADVFEFEDWALPDRPRSIDRRLLTHPRTIFTPHLGSAVDRVRREIALRAAENIVDVLAGRPPRDAVNCPRPRIPAQVD